MWCKQKFTMILKQLKLERKKKMGEQIDFCSPVGMRSTVHWENASISLLYAVNKSSGITGTRSPGSPGNPAARFQRSCPAPGYSSGCSR